MPLTTDVTIHLGEPEQVGTVEVGLSKVLSDLTVADFTDDIVNAAATDDRVQISSIWGEGIEDIPRAVYENAMLSTETNNYTGWYLNGGFGFSCGYHNAYRKGVYIRSMFALVYGNHSYQGLDTDSFTINDHNTRLVTSMDISKVYVNVFMQDVNGVTDDGTMPLDRKMSTRIHSVKTRTGNYGIYETEYSTCDIVPVWLVVRDDNIIIWSGGLTKYFDNYAGRSLYGNGTQSMTKSFDDVLSFSAQPYMYEDDDTQIDTGVDHTYNYSKDNYSVDWLIGGVSPYYWLMTPRQTKAMLMNQTSWAGAYFKVGTTLYKPIIQGGVVTGYTDNLNVPSEIDDWTDISNHDIPAEPPNIIDDSDDIDNMPLGGTAFNTGLIKYYQCTISNLDSVSSALSSQTTYTNLADNIVSLKSYAINTSNFVNTEVSVSEHIKIGKLDTNVTAPRITSYHTDLYLGSYEITGKFGDITKPHYLDKTPYTKIELYIPFCGTVQLNDFVMYKTIDVYLLVDILTGSATGIVKCNGNIISQIAGLCGVDTPITSVDNALKTNALISGGLNAVGVAAGVFSGMATKNYSGVVKSTMAGINNINNMRVAENSNYTNVKGSTGDRVINSLPSRCYIKIYRPIINENANYAHRYGHPCNKTLTLTTCNGFTMCDNAEINGNMTTKEKQLIKSLLANGVVL